MQFSVLASGSSANSTVVKCDDTVILVDCGLSATQIANKLEQVGISPSSVSALVVTHEHRDHIAGARVFSRRFRVPIFCNSGSRPHINGGFGYESFRTGEPFVIGPIEIHPFRITHDATDPVGFVISYREIRLAHVTDLGHVTPLVREVVRGVNAIVLESNHDRDLLYTCGYPWSLVQRISSNHGHLSNESASEFLIEILHGDLTHVVLGHLSENSNRPELALSTATSAIEKSSCGKPALVCASQRNQTELLRVERSSTIRSVRPNVEASVIESSDCTWA